MVKVKECSVQIRGVSYKPTDLHDALDDESIILLRANNINDDKLNLNDVVYVDKSKVSDEQYLRIGDILVCTSSGSKNLVGKATIIKTNIAATFGAFCKVVRPKDILPDYLGHYFTSSMYRNTISQLSAGANINNIKNEHIDSLEIPLPPLETQKQIAANLDKVTHTIDLCNNILEKLDLLVKSRFIELFGDYDLSHPQESWVAIKEIGTVVGGATPKTDRDEYWGGSFRWITPAELEAGSGYIYDSVRKLTKAGVESCSLQEMPVGTVILSSRAPIGKVAIAGNTFYCNQGFKNIICKEGITPRYLYTVLLLNVEYLNSLGRGATFKEISKGIVENIRIPVPATDLQEQFSAFVEQTDKSKSAVKQVLEKAETLKKALMQEYFG
ncbi:MAG: restriction endonuclease subunit S [Ruminococcus sp.]|nr:restriction endonuclease subunit S [Ruminococcus sp.]